MIQICGSFQVRVIMTKSHMIEVLFMINELQNKQVCCCLCCPTINEPTQHHPLLQALCAVLSLSFTPGVNTGYCACFYTQTFLFAVTTFIPGRSDWETCHCTRNAKMISLISCCLFLVSLIVCFKWVYLGMLACRLLELLWCTISWLLT